MKKAASLLIPFTIAFLFVYIGTHNSGSIVGAIRNLYRSVASSRSDIATRPWKDTVVLVDNIKVDVPWPLQSSEVKLPPNIAKLTTHLDSFSHEEDGLTVAITKTTFQTGFPLDLDAAADGGLKQMRAKPGTLSIDSKQNDVKIDSERGIEAVGVINTARSAKYPFHFLVFSRGSVVCLVMSISEGGQSHEAEVWERMKKSLLATPLPITMPQSATSGKLGDKAEPSSLPSGMRRR